MKKAMEMRRDPKGLSQHLQNAKTMIAGFIDAQVVRRGLDWRTGEAYRIDLEHFYKWLDVEGTQEEGQKIGCQDVDPTAGTRQVLPRPESPPRTTCGFPQDGHRWKEKMEAYLEYLTLEKKLRPSTVARKSRVFNYYLSYLVRQGILLDCGPLKLRQAAGRMQSRRWDVDGLGSADGTGCADGIDHRRDDLQKDGSGDDDRDRMSKTDVDAFFLALEREYNGLDSDFRKRVCLRDLVMMEFLFYHGIEVSELLRLEVSDYDQKTGVLTVRKKRGKAEKIYLYSRALRERMERWILEHGEFEREAEYRETMFLSKLGRPLSMKMVIIYLRNTG